LDVSNSRDAAWKQQGRATEATSATAGTQGIAELPETAGKPPPAKATFNGINHECHYSRTITTEETLAKAETATKQKKQKQ
jgi:hypothetical protein